jgi:adenylosuccinate lyase
MITGTLARIGDEVFELQRPEIGELREPVTPGSVGSITMPHKRNPERSEHLDTLARLTRAAAGVLLDGMSGVHERDGRSWKAEWLVLPEACQLTGAALGFAARLLEGLRVDAARMRANLDAHGAAMTSEPLMAVLAARIGKHSAHDAVYAAAMAARDSGTDLGEQLVAEGLLTKEEVAAATDPMRALGAAGAFVDRMTGA